MQIIDDDDDEDRLPRRSRKRFGRKDGDDMMDMDKDEDQVANFNFGKNCDK